MTDEPAIPEMMTVGHTRFHKGVELRTVQGATDRLYARLKKLEDER